MSINYNAGDLKDHHGISAIIERDGRIAMLYHNKFNFWTIPVGKREDGDSIEKTLVKELGEELGIMAEEFTEIKVFSRIHKRKDRDVEVVQHMFVINKYSGEIVNNEPAKHAGIKFMTLDEIRNLPHTSAAVEEMLKYYESR